jgi:transposase-like protein
MTQIRFWQYPEEFRQTAVERFRSCENIVHLAKELNVSRQTLYRWTGKVNEISATNLRRRSRASRGFGEKSIN